MTITSPPHAADDPVSIILAGLVARYPGARVLDVGGGSGTAAVPLAMQGCRVTVVDTSIDALAIMQRRAAEAGVAERVVALQSDADGLAGLAPGAEFDLVLCHHVLEELDAPAIALAAVAAALAPTGTVSVLVAGRWAAVLGQALAGRPEQAQAMLADPDGRWGTGDPLRRRFDVAQLTSMLGAAGLEVSSMAGLQVAAGLIAGSTRGSATPGSAALRQLDARLAEHPQLREIGTDLHALARPRGR